LGLENEFELKADCNISFGFWSEKTIKVSMGDTLFISSQDSYSSILKSGEKETITGCLISILTDDLFVIKQNNNTYIQISIMYDVGVIMHTKIVLIEKYKFLGLKTI
jgi:hypothetical protein